ncbi:MAG: hypothetical protein AB7D00_07240 [Rhodospirillaceae bacterium]
MDYPKSNAAIGLVDGKFTDGTTDGTVPPSLDTAAWANSVTDEILAVQTAGGFAADETKTTQMRDAIAAMIAAAVAAVQTSKLHGQCRLVLDGANLRLNPYNGNALIVGGTVRAIPVAGVSLAATGLDADTNYYIYAAMSEGAVILEASTTAHSPDATTGVEIKTGDATRTLVGMARTVAGPAWADSLTQRLVISWFNRRLRPVEINGTTSTTSALVVKLSPNVDFLSWGGAFSAFLSSPAHGNALGAGTQGQIRIDDLPTWGWASQNVYTAGYWLNLSSASTGDVAEGHHTASMWGNTGGGTAEFTYALNLTVEG